MILSLALAATACGGGGKGGSGLPTPPDSELLTAYPVLRWVPADVDFLVVARELGLGVDAAASGLDAARPVTGLGATAVGAMSQDLLGVDLLSRDDLGGIGLDLSRSAVIFGAGMAATAVMPIRDEAAVRARIAEVTGGAVTESATVDGLVVTGVVGDFLHGRWAMADGWLWAHVDLTGRDATDAWLSASRRRRRRDRRPGSAVGRRGGADPGRRHAGGGARGRAHRSPARRRRAVRAGRARPPRLRRGPRRGAAAGDRLDADAGQVGGAVVLDLADGAGLAAMIGPEPTGWSSAGPNPALLATVNVDAEAVGDALASCDGGALRGIVAQGGVRRGRGFVTSFDASGFQGDLGVALELSHRRTVSGLLDQIPMRSVFERRTSFGPYDGYSLSIPLVGTFNYILDDQRFLFGKGTGADLVKLAGQPGGLTSRLGYLEVHPGKITPATWDLAATFGGREVAQVGRMLAGWASIVVTAELSAGELAITGRAVRAAP
ncbi:MAG: hypothetical protein R2939_20545 [Kofleriaceae bacterium]